MKLLNWFKAGRGKQNREQVRSPFSFTMGGGFSNRTGTFLHQLIGMLPGSKRNWAVEAGDLWKNSVVGTGLHWIARNVGQAFLCVFQEGAEGQTKVQKHPLEMLLRRPNKYYSGWVLIASTLASLKLCGNAYWYIVRDGLGTPMEIWYLPHHQVSPTFPPNATTENWIDGYVFSPNGRPQPLAFEDVIHFRSPLLDPKNPRLGLSPLLSALREVVTDNEALNYTAGILSNLGIPGAMIAPKGETRLDDPAGLKEKYQEEYTGDNRGAVMVHSVPIEYIKLSLNPEELLLDTVHDVPESRIPSLMGLNAIVLHLKVGLKESTYNNMESAEASAWRNGILPELDTIAAEIDVQLLPLFEDVETLTVAVDSSRVRALQEDEDALYTRLVTACGGPFITIDEARKRARLPALTTEQAATLAEARQPKLLPAKQDGNNGGSGDGKNGTSQGSK